MRPTVEVAAPRHRLIARCNSLRAMAFSAEIASGVNTMAAISTPPSAEGATERCGAVVEDHGETPGQQHDRNDVGE